MARNPNWTEDEITIACAFYLNPVGRYSDVLDIVSKATGRMPKSVSAKLDNISSLDEQFLSTGRKGLTHGSHVDKIVWDKFQSDYDGMMTRAKNLLEDKGCWVDGLDSDHEYYLDTDIGPGRTYLTVTEARANQDAFRRIVIRESSNKCCLTGVAEREMLVASHIKRWEDSTPFQRTDVHNALCLNKFHDGLFDHFLMTVDENMDVYYVDGLEKTFGEEIYESMIEKYDHIKIKERNRPSPEYLEYHNKKFQERCKGRKLLA